MPVSAPCRRATARRRLARCDSPPPSSRCALGLACFPPRDARAAQLATKPTLVVLVTIDQFRADYLERFGPQLTGGLARLMRGGAGSPTRTTITRSPRRRPATPRCSSGRFPRSTGIMMNSIGVADTAAPLLAGGVRHGRVAQALRRHDARRLAARRRPRIARAVRLDEGSRRDPADRHARRATSTGIRRTAGSSTSKYYRDSLPGLGDGVQRPALAAELRRQAVDAAAAGQRVSRSRTACAPNRAASGFTFPHALPDDWLEAANIVRAHAVHRRTRRRLRARRRRSRSSSGRARRPTCSPSRFRRPTSSVIASGRTRARSTTRCCASTARSARCSIRCTSCATPRRSRSCCRPTMASGRFRSSRRRACSRARCASTLAPLLDRDPRRDGRGEARYAGDRHRPEPRVHRPRRVQARRR